MTSQNSKLFREYIQGKGVKFPDVPINSNVQFHFILAFAIDYTTSGTPSPTNGEFDTFWDVNNLSPDEVYSIKNTHPNVKVALSLGGERVRNDLVYFSPSDKEKWVSNAVSSLTSIIKQYHLDGIDIDYEQFTAGTDTFAECIGRLITTLKRNEVISFASIAPPVDKLAQSYYFALWENYKSQIDYVNFQFYKYPIIHDTTLFHQHFDTQNDRYDGDKVLVSYISDGSGGLSPGKEFIDACTTLKKEKKLHGIFVWSADLSKVQPPPNGFSNETKAQQLLADISH